jgi:hypothetical protein
MQRLSSRTLRPSLTESFVDKWTSSLEDSRANHSVLLESVKQLKTPDTSFPTSQTESESANLELFSLKTYKESSPAKLETESQFSNLSSESWKEWVTEQRQEYSQRKKSAHLTNASESSYLGWPTARTSDAEGGRIETDMTSEGFKSKRHRSNQTFGAKLRDAVETHEENWVTPIANDAKGSDYGYSNGKKVNYLGGQVKNWATPNTMDHMEQRSPEALQRQFNTTRKGRTAPANLREQIHPQNWATPQVTDVRTDVRKPSERSEKANKGGCKNLREEVMQPQNWPTATTRDWKDTNATVPPSRATPSKQTLGQRVAHVGLQDQANLNTTGKNQESWPTPRANKVHPQITEENREHLANRNKANLEEDIAGHCGKATGKLNPNWVEHLMGLPVGWTDLGSWETE